MKCFEFRQKIDRWLRDGVPPKERDECAAHMNDCPLCREAYSDAVLARALRDEPVPEPDEGFADRVMDRAINRSRQRSRSRMFTGFSAAAAVLVVFFVGYLLGFTSQKNPVSESRPIRMVLSREKDHSIGILIRAREFRRDATLTVDLQGRVALRDMPGRRSVSWRTDLVQGRNLLELPIEVRNGSGGRIRVGYRYDNVEQEVSIRVKPSGKDSRNNRSRI